MNQHIENIITEIDVTCPPKRKIAIGHQGEHKFRKVVFDVSKWHEYLPSGKTTIVIKRKDGETYPVVMDVSGDKVEYSPSRTDTAVVGDGWIEVRMVGGDVTGKSCKMAMIVESSLSDPISTPDDPGVDWIGQIVDAVREEKEAAQAAATRAETAATNASTSATRAANSAAASATSANNAANAINNMNIDLEADAAAGKLYVVIDGDRKGNGAEGVGGGGLGIDDWGITTDENSNNYMHLYDEEGEDLLDPLLLPATGSGSGGGTGSTVRITNRTGWSSTTVGGGDGDVTISYSWTSVDENGDATGAGTAYWYANGSRVASQPGIAQGNQSFNVRPYLTEGIENVVKLTVEDGNMTTRSMTWRITVTVYGLTWRISDVNLVGTGSLSVPMIPTGAGTKTLHLTVGNNDEEVAGFPKTITASGSTVTGTIPAQSHGAHRIKAWVTAVVDGETISTDPLVATGVWITSGNNNPIVAIQTESTTVAQYSSVPFNYFVYHPNYDSVSATIKVNNKDVPGGTVTAGRQMQTWYYQPTEAGTYTVSITCSGVTDSVTLTVTDIGVDIGEVTEGLVVSLNPKGHSNNEANRLSFGYTDANGTNHPLAYSSNFDWVNGGFQTDDDGTALVVKRGTYAELDTGFFHTFAANRGKEFKIVFKSKNVRNYDAQLLTCYPGAGNSGIVVNAQNATLYSSGNSATVQYVEEKRIEMDVNIESSSEDKLAVVWLKGIPSSAFPYTNDIWEQGTKRVIRIGSNDADVWIYLIRMYDSSLTRTDILANFIADSSDVTEMLSRYNRNNIFSTDASRSIDLNKLAAAAPNLRVLQITAADMTTAKDDKVICTVRHTYPAGALSDGTNPHNWTAEGVTMKAQGTSSLDYIASALNLDLDFKKATSWADDDGNTMKKYAMTNQSIAVAYFNIKANVASSESANNVVLADDYNTYNPFIAPAKQEDSGKEDWDKVRDTVEGHPCAVFFTNNGSENVVLGSRTCQPGETMLYFVGDMNNSKKNTDVFGQDNETYAQQCCVEVTNNNTDPARFKASIAANETFTGVAVKKGGDHDDDFEFRYPEEPTAEMIAAFREMHAWVVSTDPEQATGSTLSPYWVDPKTQTSFYVDSADYRRAKFVAEVGNYFSVDSLLFHYLFTERHCMVDNRAKNTFISYEYDSSAGGYRWNYRCDYDNDTAEGNDNSGGLTFSYGLEDTDTVAGAGSGYVFNAHDSVLWCNLRDLMKPELRAMYVDRESAGAWNSSRILAKFLAHQQARPEALDVEDMWGKYFTPYTLKQNTGFINMMLGRKEDQREQFEIYQEEYMASKYSSNLWLNDMIGLRGNKVSQWQGVEPSTTLTITPYADMYLRIDFGNAATSQHVRAKRGVPTVLTTESSFNPTDLEIQIRGASKISAISGLAAFYSKKLELSNALKLTRLEFGSGEAGYTNSAIGTDAGSLAIGNCPLLEYIDFRGLPNLRVPLNLTNLTFLDEIHADGSGFTEITFAENAKVRIATLPAVTGLRAKGLTSLETFTMSGVNLSNLLVENTPIIDSYALISESSCLSRVRVTGVDWEADNADAVLPIVYVSGYDQYGEPISDSVITGDVYFGIITQAELNTITTHFTNLNVTYGAMVGSYTVTFNDSDGTFLYSEQVREGGNAIEPVSAGLISAPTKEGTEEEKPYYTYSFSGWSASLNNITANLTVTPEFSRQDRYYNVYWYNGTSLLQRKNVKAGAAARYTGDEVSPPTGKIWGGFDRLTNKVLSDVVTYAVFYEPKAPQTYPTVTSTMFLYSDDPSDDSAYTFEEMWYLCTTLDSNGVPLCRQYFNVGDRIKIVPNTSAFTDESIILQVEDTWDHYRTGDRSKWTNVFFGMVGIMNASHTMRGSNTNSGGYDGKTSSTEVTMASWLDSTIYNALPPQWKGIMESWSVASSKGGGSTEIVYNPHKIALRSQTDVFGDTGTPYGGEVETGATYKQLRAYTGSKIKKMYNGTASSGSGWWLRSPAAGSSTNYTSVNNNGSSNSTNASFSIGVSWGFCVGSHES